jgi:hypothetical protein
MNHRFRAPLSTIGLQFSLSLWERAGVRENCSSGNVVRSTESSTIREFADCAAAHGAYTAQRAVYHHLLRQFEGFGDSVKDRRVAVKKSASTPRQNLKGVVGVGIDVDAIFDMGIADGCIHVIGQPGM